jgi:hypothetical protein
MEGAHPSSLDLPDASLPSGAKPSKGEANLLIEAQAASEEHGVGVSATEQGSPDIEAPAVSPSDQTQKDVSEQFGNLKVGHPPSYFLPLQI